MLWEDRAALCSLRDALRSARRWRALISESERQRLLTDIARVGLAVGQDLYPERGINDLDIGFGDKGDDACPRERLAFLGKIWPQLAGALVAIEAAPHTRLVPRTQTVPLQKARRIAPLALLAALRSGDFAAVPPEKSSLANRLKGRVPRRIQETICVPCRDTPENRAVKFCLAHVARDLAAIALLAEAVSAAAIAREAERLRARLRRHLRRAPWRDLPLPSTARPSLTPTLRAHPHYRLILDTYRRYRQAFRFDWNNPIFTLPARETWLLYEYWGFFQVADALRTLGCRATHADDFALNRSGLTFSLAQGRASQIRFTGQGGEKLTLTYNPTFAPASLDAGIEEGWHSRSYAMRPDVTLEAAGRLLVFDTKFKTYAESGWEGEDMRQMHTYRDAIVRDDRRGVVTQAWLLYAGQAEGENRRIIAYPASTFEHPFGSGNVGALLLRPGRVGNEHLQAILAGFLNRTH